VEFTAATKDTDKFSEAVCAFANDLPNHGTPGYLIVGIDDAGRFAGLKVTDELLRNLGGLRDDGNIQPLPNIAIEKITTSDGDVAVVAVQPAMLPPVLRTAAFPPSSRLTLASCWRPFGGVREDDRLLQ
ncbi:MAG: AlbA family DNA-binding domain-containing protein, partial [Thermoanaerobaculia bacterium]